MKTDSDFTNGKLHIFTSEGLRFTYFARSGRLLVTKKRHNGRIDCLQTDSTEINLPLNMARRELQQFAFDWILTDCRNSQTGVY